MKFALLPSGTLISIEHVEAISPRTDGKPGAEISTENNSILIDLPDYNALVAILKTGLGAVSS